ncbi:mitogen-activated protein kinase kinase kinase 20-like [Actinidia eriantha]|uniref:mitogen-activated protein kinase kinase kinase 20-like n=1 Tax=Actinidia eriantha TaxID=165200 RepID=UPI0025907002|nr:mitogen-activated protein kinase kinase kinase 20-like [Actinidia eriantha]
MKRKREDEFQCETVEEVKQRSTDKCGGDGVAWFRGSMIGKGSFGSVYLANLKKPRSRFGCFPEVMAVKSAEISVSGSIQKEREALSNIGRCPNVIRCFGDEITTGENGEMVYNLLLEFGSGGTLADLIKKSGGSGLSESDVRYYARSILHGINHIHELGYVHCDLKPENILLVPKKKDVGAKFKVKIGDFGMAKRASQNKKRKLDPYMRGTPMYLSPEVVTDCIQEPPSDIWAFGCIVLEMLTGKPLWFGKQDMDAEALLRMIGEGYESPKIPDEISREGREFLKGCFSRKSMFRFTADMLLNHSFFKGLVDDDDDDVEEGEVILVTDEVDSSLMLFKGDDEECSSSFYSDDYCYESVDEFLFSSWSEEGEEIDSQYFLGFSKEGTLEGQEGTDTTGSITASSLEDVISTSKQVSANTVQHCSNTFPIRSGVATDCIQKRPSDIWAFGCIVLEMVTGKPPWFGKEDMDTEALLHMIGEGYESPKIPDEVSTEGRQFLKGCFSR